MLNRKLFVPIAAIFMTLLMGFPAYAAMVTYGGTVDTLSNPLRIDGIRWGYDDADANFGVLDGWYNNIDSFWVKFYDGSTPVLEFESGDARVGSNDPQIYLSGGSPTGVLFSSDTFSSDFSGDTTLSIEPDQYPNVVFKIDGIYTGSPIYIEGTLSFQQVPIPNAVWLLSSGLVGLVGLRMRNRRV